jgi:hypothetical protein
MQISRVSRTIGRRGEISSREITDEKAEEMRIFLVNFNASAREA